MSSQDWAPVVISKKKPATGTTVKDVDAVRCVSAANSQFAALTRAGGHAGAASGGAGGRGEEMCVHAPATAARRRRTALP
jgi:hypothetical protein